MLTGTWLKCWRGSSTTSPKPSYRLSCNSFQTPWKSWRPRESSPWSLLFRCVQSVIIIIIIYFENVHFLCYARVRGLPMWSPSTHPWIPPIQDVIIHTFFQVFLFLPLYFVSATSIFLQADTQSSTLLRSRCPNHLDLPRLTTSATLCTPWRLYKSTLCIRKNLFLVFSTICDWHLINFPFANAIWSNSYVDMTSYWWLSSLSPCSIWFPSTIGVQRAWLIPSTHKQGALTGMDYNRKQLFDCRCCFYVVKFPCWHPRSTLHSVHFRSLSSMHTYVCFFTPKYH